MNRIFTLLFLFFAFTVSGQNYFEFPDSNAVWSVNLDKYAVNGDTVINSTTYKKYYKTAGDSIFYMDSAFYFGAVREDTNKRVWGILANDTVEKLQYDFSLNIGDTIEVFPLYGAYWWLDSVELKVLDIDSIILEFEWRKSFRMADKYGQEFHPEEWIEGIGSTTGLFSQGMVSWNIVDAGFPTLLCFHENDSLKYDEPFLSSCFISEEVGIKEQNGTAHSIILYPNPTTGVATIQNSGDRIQKVEVYDVFGRPVPFEFDSGRALLDMQGSLPGLYFVQFSSGNEILTRKLLIK